MSPVKEKLFRDPIYGYIGIDADIVHDIIDTAAFQRLRDIRQTSYAPLYPSALHNRFVHSLGVYFLGRMAFHALRKYAFEFSKEGENYSDILSKDEWDRYEEIFGLACLLHDIGHSPFSHTGEAFFSNSVSCVPTAQAKTDDDTEGYYTYTSHLSMLTEDPVFNDAIVYNSSEHEIMSSIVALETFGDKFWNSHEKSFFARCITGIRYPKDSPEDIEKAIDCGDDAFQNIQKNMLLNCFISLLNSSLIDVDRLDYIIRDAGTMGYQTVSIDHERLLNGIVIVKKDRYVFTIGYHKNAISVIENVVYAHDNERKWVQGHPVILYEAFLLSTLFGRIEESLRKESSDLSPSLFSFDALSDKGCKIRDVTIRYLSDSDMIFLMKNIFRDKDSDEYFFRNTRKHPIWKSEAEYKHLFADKTSYKCIIDNISLILGRTAAGMKISDATIASQQTEIDKLGENFKEKRKNLLKTQKTTKCLLDTCQECGLERDITVVSTSFFKSNFAKSNLKEALILFPGNEKPSCFGDVTSVLFSESPVDEKVYYLFSKPMPGKQIDSSAFSKALLKSFSKIEWAL